MATPIFHRYSPQKGGWKVPAGQRLQYINNQGYKTVPIPGWTPPAPPAPPPTLDSQINGILNKQFGFSNTLIGKQADALKAEAASRQQNYQAAYQAAAEANSKMGVQAQEGWQKAGNALAGISGALTGEVGAQTQQAAAGVDRFATGLGGAATGYDATTQQGVENYYSGTLPFNEATKLGGIANQAAVDQAQALNIRGLQEGAATRKNTDFEILKNQTAALSELAGKRPDAYNSLRTLFATEKQNTIANRIAEAELTARQLSDANALKFKYAELAQNATTEAEKLKWQKLENAEDRKIDQINANANKKNAQTSEWQAKHPNATPTKTTYNTGTYQQKLAAVMQDELQRVESTFVIPPRPKDVGNKDVDVMIPILSNATGRPVTVKKNGKTVKKMQPFSERVWANNQRLTYREYVFAKLWPMIEGNIAKGNREKAKRYLRSKLWKVALQWDPSEVTEESGLPGATGAATGKNTVS